MGKIKLETKIKSSTETCFDLSRSVDLHIASAQETNERAIDGVTSGLMALDDIVTWEATHFGIKQKLKVKISKFDRPTYFQDTQIDGIFKSFTHDHFFHEENGYTLMSDVFDFHCPYGIIGWFVDPLIYTYIKKFLTQRNALIKSVAEGGDWAKFI